jgi:hypothetical protein
MPVFGGWLRNVEDENMPVAWPYLRELDDRLRAARVLTLSLLAS